MDTIDPKRIASSIDRWRTDSFPMYMRERTMVAFYNSGPMPIEEECTDEPPTSLGLGYRYIKRPHDQLMDICNVRPGMIKTKVQPPENPADKFAIETALDTELNKMFAHRLTSTMRTLAGRALITGRAFLYRRSRYDWKFHSGRLLCPMTYGDDVYCSDFREWAFRGQLTLRDIDARIDTTREYDGSGWNKSGLRGLKTYILKLTDSDKNDLIVTDKMLETPFRKDISDNPLDVYWYFRKTGKKSRIGFEFVDLYCISRYLGGGTINSQVTEQGIFKSLSLKPADEGVHMLYHLPNAFESVDECLIPFILDSRIDGEQEMMQVEGTGKIMVPRIAAMESLADSILQGVSFGVQPNWTYETGSALEEQEMKKLARSGVAPYDAVPKGVIPMAKNNSFTGFNGGMQMLSMLGMSAEQDAATGEMSPMGQSQANFRSEAELQISQMQASVGRRSQTFFVGVDQWMNQIVKTFTRSFFEWERGDEAYDEVLNFQMAMITQHGILPTEYDSAYVEGYGRRLSGDQDKAGAIQSVMMAREAFGDQISPQGHRMLAKEGARAIYGDDIAELLIPDEQEPPQDQVLLAVAQNTMALDSLVPPQRQPQDNPIIHADLHAKTIMARLQAIAQAGSITPLEKAGLTALMQHAAQDVVGLPPGLREQTEMQMVEVARMIAKLPMSGAQTQMALKEKELAIKEQDFALKQQGMESLMQDREKKTQVTQQKLMLEIQKAANAEKNGNAQAQSLAVQNAAIIAEQIRKEQEFNMEKSMAFRQTQEAETV